MKHVVIVIVSCFLILFCQSCNQDSNSQVSSDRDAKIEALSDTIKKHLIKQDSLYKELVGTFDSIAIQLSDSKIQIEQLKQNAEKAQEPRLVLICVAITALFLSLLTLLLVYFKTRNSLSKKKAEAFISDYLNNYRDDSKSYNEFIKKLDSRVWHLEKLMRQTSSNSQGEQINESYFPDLEKRLLKLERIVNSSNGVAKSVSHSYSFDHKSPLSEQKIDNGMTKVAYANINTGNFFVDLLDSKQETCVFSISFKKDDYGEFNIISLDKLKSRNGWQEVVEATGDCTLAEANSYDVLEKGQCKNIEANTWEVTRKLKIKIRK